MSDTALADANLRVRDAAKALGLEVAIDLSAKPTRTAEDAAAVRGCHVGQIVKSLIFEGSLSGKAVLLLVSGANRVDEARVEGTTGEALTRPDAAFVRDVTGYAIGGIPPFGHKTTLASFIDRDLMDHDLIYAAAGTPNSTFAIDPQALQAAIGARVIAMK